MDRKPIVAGQFYTAEPQALAAEVRRFLSAAEGRADKPTLLAMAPHAGYVFSGAVAGATLGRAGLADTVILLGPNHTGMGSRYAVWHMGAWLFPGGGLAVDEALAELLISRDPRLTPDRTAHLNEHSLEVLVPFLWTVNPDMRVVPICVGGGGVRELVDVGLRLGETLKARKTPASIVVSSDMSHYISREEAEVRDSLALEAIRALDPEALYEVVRANGISMCGVLPMVVGLSAAKALGATEAEVAAYATSGEVNGDMSRVVGYAGVLVS
ncbi:AmmeMemoRadiSam system protein B [Desulfovibrio aminophilus]|nr:AmmeMemoRadiSam system protein B [Desulfovibrio aminophilus]MCM0755225.1 AmmeMemoRadiSam system protein B [Desulfovibrio aminophilus]